MDAEELFHPNPLRMNPVPRDFTPPVAKNFSFSVSGLWKSNGNMLRWITEVPSVHHDLTFEPAPSQAEKHKLVSWGHINLVEPWTEYEKDLYDTLDGHDGGKHRNKKAKLSSKGGTHGAATSSRRGRVVRSTCDAARRLSSSFQSVFSTRSHAETDASTPKEGGSIPYSPLLAKLREKMRFAVVGDSNSGKTCMLL
jgi:hypothetical protein